MTTHCQNNNNWRINESQEDRPDGLRSNNFMALASTSASASPIVLDGWQLLTPTGVTTHIGRLNLVSGTPPLSNKSMAPAMSSSALNSLNSARFSALPLRLKMWLAPAISVRLPSQRLSDSDV